MVVHTTFFNALVPKVACTYSVWVRNVVSGVGAAGQSPSLGAVEWKSCVSIKKATDEELLLSYFTHY